MTTALAFLFVLGILVLVHEFGHFIVARLCGVRVEKFSFGFGPKLLGKKIGETEYLVSGLPLGGYVKLAGENPDDATGGNPWEFMSKPIWQRSLVILAGPVMNFILAIVLFWGILFVSGRQIPHSETTVIGQVAVASPAEKAGLKSGDRILSVDGTEVTNFSQMADLINKQVEKPVAVRWEREGKVFEKEITTLKEKTYDENGRTIEVGRIGIGPTVTRESLNLFQSFYTSLALVIGLCGEIFRVIYGLFAQTVSMKALGGPIFIAQVAGQTAQQGFLSLLSFTGLLSVNLAVLNLLPIPVLDGGHLLFLGMEKIRRRPLSIKQRLVFQQVGMGLLLLLILLVTYNDIFRLFGR